ncbi:hypothetical protein R3P38DRAFT_3351535 [Favolaschia claudopus]|uniref:Uncharacterized protein n=1 Tax=Favolaschia claudopus TaxID=2862362 RepID=A0AAW0C6F2_9AGAR
MRGLSLHGRREAARHFDCTELRPSSGASSAFSPGILPPAGKNCPPCLNERVPPELHQLFSSSRKRRAAALYRVEYIELLPASDISRFCRRQAKAAPPKSKLKATSSRATLLVDAPRSGANVRVYRFSFAEQHYKFRTCNLTQVEFPIASGIRFFAVRRANFAMGSPRAALYRSSKLKINIKISISRRPPSDVRKVGSPQSCQHQRRTQNSTSDFSASAER